MSGDEQAMQDIKNKKHQKHDVERKADAEGGDKEIASSGQQEDGARHQEQEGRHVWDGLARTAAESMPLGEGGEAGYPRDDNPAERAQQWWPSGALTDVGRTGNVAAASEARNDRASVEDWARAAPAARERRPTTSALAVYSWGVEARKGGVREMFTATIAQAKMTKVWSNGDVLINSGGRGATPAAKVILNIFLKVFKVEIAEVDEDKDAVKTRGSGWQIEHQTGYRQAFSENMSMSLFANRDWPYIKTKLKRLPTKIFLPKERSTEHPPGPDHPQLRAPRPPQRQELVPPIGVGFFPSGQWTQAAPPGKSPRGGIALNERSIESQEHHAQSFPPPGLHDGGGGGSTGSDILSSAVFATVAAEKGVPPELVQQLLRAAGGSTGAIAALAAAAVAAVGSGGGVEGGTEAESPIVEAEGGSRGFGIHQVGRRVSPSDAGNAGVDGDGNDAGHLQDHDNNNPHYHPAALSQGPPVAVVAEAVASSPPHRSDPTVTARKAHERDDSDRGRHFYDEDRRSWARSRSRSRDDGRVVGVGAETRRYGNGNGNGHERRPTRSPEGWRPWRPEDDSPTSPRRPPADDFDGSSWRGNGYGRRRRRVDEGRRRMMSDNRGRGSGDAWWKDGRGGRGGGFDDYRGGDFSRRGDVFGRAGGFGTRDGEFGREGVEFSRRRYFGRGDGNRGRHGRLSSSPSREGAEWPPSRDGDREKRQRDSAARQRGREHGRELKPPPEDGGDGLADSRGSVGRQEVREDGRGSADGGKEQSDVASDRDDNRAGGGGNIGQSAVVRRDSYDPEQYDPDAYDPGEVTVKREDNESAGGVGSRKRRSISRSVSLTRVEEQRRPRSRNRSRSRSRPRSPSGRRDESSSRSAGEPWRGAVPANERFDNSPSRGYYDGDITRRFTSSHGGDSGGMDDKPRDQLSVQDDRGGFDYVGVSNAGGGNASAPWADATDTASFAIEQQWEYPQQQQQQLQAPQLAPLRSQESYLPPSFALPSGLTQQQLPILPPQHQMSPAQHPQQALLLTTQQDPPPPPPRNEQQQQHEHLQHLQGQQLSAQQQQHLPLQQQQQPTAFGVYNSGGAWHGASQGGTRPG